MAFIIERKCIPEDGLLHRFGELRSNLLSGNCSAAREYLSGFLSGQPDSSTVDDKRAMFTALTPNGDPRDIRRTVWQDPACVSMLFQHIRNDNRSLEPILRRGFPFGMLGDNVWRSEEAMVEGLLTTVTADLATARILSRPGILPFDGIRVPETDDLIDMMRMHEPKYRQNSDVELSRPGNTVFALISLPHSTVLFDTGFRADFWI